MARLYSCAPLLLPNANEETLSCSASRSGNVCFCWSGMSAIQSQRATSRPHEREVGGKDQGIVLLGFRGPALRRHARAAMVSGTLDARPSERRERRSPYQQVLRRACPASRRRCKTCRLSEERL